MYAQTDERKAFFEKVHEEARNAGKKGWGALSFLVRLKGQSFKKYPLPTSIPNIPTSNIRKDAVSSELYPNDAPSELIPIQIYGDGNCLFRTLSFFVFGHEDNFKEMRVRIVFELVSNLKRYTNENTFVTMSTNKSSLQYVFESSLSEECLITGDLIASLQKETIKTTQNGYYSSLLHMFVASNVLQKPIMSIFPEVQNPGVNRQDHNQLIVPLDRADAKEYQDAIHIMWTQTIATKIDGWTPNHFVACIHKHEEPLSKRSRLSFEDSEPHRSFEPKQSQDSPSPLLESNTNEESIETEDDISEIPVQKAQVVHEKWHTPEIGSTPNQPRNIFFPAKKFGKKMRSFNASWFDRWSWLHYVEIKDVVFCFPCIKSFQKKTLSCHKKEKAFISSGFKNWKKATTKFAAHEKSDCHKEAMEREFTIKEEVKDVGECLSKTHEVEKKSNRENLLKITNILKFLARQGIALRGDKDEKNSNFNQLLMLEAKRDPQLQEWLQRKTNKYVAPDIQNEILQVMGLQVLRQIVAFIKSSEFFSIMADETRDISNKEQLVLCIRWVDQNFTAHEDLLGMYCLSDIGANSITLAIKDALLRFDLPINKVRGQCYDMAASMAGSKTGVATQIHALEPRALYIHCYGHALNLACSDSIKGCKLLRDTLDIAKDITKLIKESPRREMIFNTLKNAQNLEKTSAGIRVLCPTRWTIKADTFLSILSNYEILRNVWDESLQYVREVEMRNRIRGVAAYMCRFDFFFGCLLSEKLLRYSDNLARALQAPNLSASDGQKMASTTMSALQSLRDETIFTQFYEEVVEKAKQMNIDDPVLPRKRKIPRKLDDGTAAHTFSSCADMYRKDFYEALDLLLAGIKSRFDQPGYKAYVNLENLVIKACTGQTFEEEFNFVTTLYDTDLKPKDLHCQLIMLKTVLPKDFTPDIPSVVEFFRHSNEKSLFAEILKILKLILVLPATNATSERSFSALKRLKTSLRSTMSQIRTNNLLLLHVHKNETDELNPEKIVEEFVSESEHRLAIFGKFTEY